MTAHPVRTPRKTRRMLVAGLTCLPLAAAVSFVSAAPATAAATAGTGTAHLLEVGTGFTYEPVGGKPTHLPPSGPPKTGDRIELTGDVYAGDHIHHSKRPIGTDHTICLVDATGNTFCDSQAAFGGAMLLLSGKGADGDFNTPITGGTGWLTGAGGYVHNHPVPNSESSDLTVHLRL